MKFRALFFMLSILLPAYSDSQSLLSSTTQKQVNQVTFKAAADDVQPSAQGTKVGFKSVSEWLITITNGNQPQKHISQYNIRLFEAPGACTLSLTGVNTYKEGIGFQSTRIDYTPREMYCDLPPAYFQNLTRDQLPAKIIEELKSFTASASFKNSFLAQADQIVLESNGEVIWKKN
ncbi:hypothetical protein [Mucilaginibacter sp. CSA2-8R]|uniref:hypothetical protein n=1 Tax=Mucilaginibacter sp. CSA2-8R TaxID=3141542 RepID=UPI00315CA64B